MLLFVIKVILAAGIIAIVSTVAGKYPRLGALLLSLPTVSILSFIFTWQKEKNLESIALLSYETLFLIFLTLPFFIIVAFAPRLNLTFWNAMFLGIAISGLCILVYLYFSLKSH